MFLFIILFSKIVVYSQCITDVDFTSWSSHGSPYDWHIINDSTVEFIEDTNPIHTPVFFVSPDYYINARIKGQMMVSSANTSHDFIGFVFGYKQPVGNSNYYNFYLFDWNGSTTTYSGLTSTEGMALIKVSMQMNDDQLKRHFWSHQEQAGGFKILDKVYSPLVGWEYDQWYDFEPTYNSNRIVVAIDNDTIFDVPGCFQPGKFGFYSLSQMYSTYRNFSYGLSADFYTDQNSVCLGEPINFFSVHTNCYIPENIVSWDWDFGDGTISNEHNPVHYYSEAGYYSVMLKVVDDLGCVDSVFRSVRIRKIPEVEIHGDDLVPFNETGTVMIEGDYDEVNWSHGGSEYIYTVENLRSDSLFFVEVNLQGCLASDEFLMKVGDVPVLFMPNAFNPNSILNPTFKTVTNSSEKFRMLIMNRWGKIVCETDDINNGWDGNMLDGVSCPQGVYIWKIFYDAFNENYELVERTNEGTVTLVR